MSMLKSEDVRILTTLILEQFGSKSPEDLSALVKKVAERMQHPKASDCNHKQLYAHVTIDLVLPVEHNSAAEMTRLLDRIYAAFDKTELEHVYKVRSGIEVDENDAV
jgi:hypothetical protein